MKITRQHYQEYSHERDDLLDDLGKLEEAALRADTERVATQRQRISTHLRRIEELGRLAKLLEEN